MPLPKTDSENNQSCYRMKSPMAQVHNKNHAKKCRFFPDDFGLRSPVIQKKVQTKTATSVVAHVSRLLGYYFVTQTRPIAVKSMKLIKSSLTHTVGGTLCDARQRQDKNENKTTSRAPHIQFTHRKKRENN